MSIVASTTEEICHSPTNNSRAKMLYSFPRSSRFPKDKENQCDRFYEISSKAEKRATNLGYGTKYDFTKDMPKTPAPGAYEPESVFEAARKKNKGFGFGSGRGEMQATGFIKSNANPGPGTYDMNSTRSPIHFSIKGKTKIDNREAEYVPGPGAYETISNVSPAGRLFSSKFRNKSACRFGRQEKLHYENRKTPGPGTYDSSKVQMSPDGRYFYSRLQSAKNSKFGRQPRLPSENRCQTPGPGNYRMPSEFGYYVSRNTCSNVASTTLPA